MEVREKRGLYEVLAETLMDPCFLRVSGRTEEDIRELLRSSLGREMCERLFRWGRKPGGRFDCSKVEEIVCEYIRELRDKPEKGWCRYIFDSILSELFPETHSEEGEESKATERGRILFLRILRALFTWEREKMSFDPTRDISLLGEDEITGATAEEYLRLIRLTDVGYIYEMMRIAADITPFDTLGHMFGVHYVAMHAARQLAMTSVPVDLPLISGAAVGHDIGKFGCRKTEEQRVPYLHYYYTDICYGKYGLPRMGHIAANHSTWDLELENLSVESLLLIYADFRVKSGRENGKETVRFLSLEEAFDVILGKLDNVDAAKEARYRKVYAKLADFEAFMREKGVDPDLPRIPTPVVPEPSPVVRERVLLDGQDVVDQLKFSSIDHNIRLMSILNVDSELADLIEAARSETAWKNVRTYIGILDEYSTYFTEEQKLMTLRFLYELLAHKDGDIRSSAAELMGGIIAGFNIKYMKELPEGVTLPRQEKTNLSLTDEYVQKIIYPERRFTDQHRQWMRGSLNSFFTSLLRAGKPDDRCDYVDALLPYYGGDIEEEELSVVLLNLFGRIHLEDCSREVLEAVQEHIDAGLDQASTAIRIAALRASRHMSDGAMSEDEYFERLSDILGMEKTEEGFARSQSAIFLDDLKMGTHWMIKIANIELMRYHSRISEDTGLILHLGTHLVNLLKVNERMDVRRAAGDTLLSLIPRLPDAQRNELGVELYNGLEIGDRQYAKHVPYYLGKLSLSLAPAEFVEMIDTLEVAMIKASTKVAAFMIEAIGVILENYGEFQENWPELPDQDHDSLKRRLMFMMIKAYAHFDEQFSRDAFRCIGQHVFAGDTLAEEDKYMLFIHSCKKILMLLDEGVDDDLSFYSNAATLNHIYRYITARERKGGFIFPDRTKVCFYPGTFDPYSLGHKALAVKIRDLGFDVYLAIDEFSWSKHTQAKLLRRKIVNMSNAGEEGLYTFPDDIPINIANPLDIARLKALFPGKELFVAVGTDVIENASAYTLEPGENTVHSLNHIVFDRQAKGEKGTDEGGMEVLLASSSIGGKVISLGLDEYYDEISSTRIRENIDLNRDVSNLIDSTAQSFIYEHGMYLREPTYKHVLEAREMAIDEFSRRDGGFLSSIAGKLAARGKDPEKIMEYVSGSGVRSVCIRDISSGSEEGVLLGCAACHKVGTRDLLSEFHDAEITARIRDHASGSIASIGFLFAEDNDRISGVPQMMITELLTELIARDYTYAVYDPVEKDADDRVLKALKKQGFVHIGNGLYAVDMKAPVVIFKDVETVIKAPLNKNPRVIRAIEEAHDSLLSVMAGLYPGKLLLSFNTGAIQNKIISKMARLNGVSTTASPGPKGHYMAVPFGKALGDVLVPNTVTKTLVVEKYFNRLEKGFTIAESPGHSTLDTQVKMIKSFGRPVVLIDDLLHKSHRMNKLGPILRANDVDVMEVLVGVMTGNAMDRMEASNTKVESAYFLPTLELWLNERDCYPFIGGDSLESAGKRGIRRGASANLVLPYIKPGFLGNEKGDEAYVYSEVCLRNARSILKVLEEEYQKTFGRKLTLKRLGEVMTIPRIPEVDRGVSFDENLEPSVFIDNDLERLARLKWGAK